MIKMMKLGSQLGVHLAVAVAVTYAMTGSLALGGLIAIVEPLCNIAAGAVHEKAWAKLAVH